MNEYTLSILKPDAVSRNITGKINSYLESASLKIVAQKMLLLSKKQAQEFYSEHAARPFYNSLVSYMISGPVVVQVLKGINATTKNREIMGNTNPAEAASGTIRRDLGIDIERNTVHGSDSLDSARREIDFFFSKIELCE